MTDPDRRNPFDGPQLQGVHHRRADMSGANFDGVNLDRARFFAVMTSATFTDTNLGAATFDDVNLAGAKFNNVNLSGSTVTDANLSRLSIRGVTLADTDIQDADLTEMRINGVLVSDLFAAYKKASS